MAVQPSRPQSSSDPWSDQVCAAISRAFVSFFFSGRRRHTSSPRDWSSDVCSSDLGRLLTSYFSLRSLLKVWQAISKLRKEKYEVSSLPYDDKGREEAAYVNKLLAETIDTKGLQNQMTLKEALSIFYERFQAKGKELPILIDNNAFKEENADAPDGYDTQVKFPECPK